MRQVEPIEYVERGRCDCGVHFLGRCDSDFPATTHGLPYTPRQKELMREARKQLGMPPPVFSDELSVTSDPLSVTVTDKCAECGEPFESKRSDAQFCSSACRKRNSRR